MLGNRYEIMSLKEEPFRLDEPYIPRVKSYLGGTKSPRVSPVALAKFETHTQSQPETSLD